VGTLYNIGGRAPLSLETRWTNLTLTIDSYLESLHFDGVWDRIDARGLLLLGAALQAKMTGDNAFFCYIHERIQHHDFAAKIETR
jgi:hypothetical protein